MKDEFKVIKITKNYFISSFIVYLLKILCAFITFKKF